MIDGSKALRKAIEKVFGQRHPIQRCRNHKLRNVLGHLPKDQHPQVKAAFRAAMKLDREAGRAEARAARPMARARPPLGLGQPTRRPQRDVHDQPARPPAAAEEVPGLDQPDRQHPLGRKTEDPQGDPLEERSDGLGAWAAASFVETEKSYRRIIGYHQLWMLRAHLDDHEPVAEMRKAG